jgi:hypothetical protein
LKQDHPYSQGQGQDMPQASNALSERQGILIHYYALAFIQKSKTLPEAGMQLGCSSVISGENLLFANLTSLDQPPPTADE